MMKCKPEQRITPFNAMQHSFLNGKQKKNLSEGSMNVFWPLVVCLNNYCGP